MWRLCCGLLLWSGNRSRDFIWIRAVSGQWRKLCRFRERLIRGVEKTLKVRGGDGAMRLRILLRIDEHVSEPIGGSNRRHGGERLAIVFGGALIVAASLFKLRREREDGGITRESIERLMEPLFGLCFVVGSERSGDCALEIAG